MASYHPLVRACVLQNAYLKMFNFRVFIIVNVVTIFLILSVLMNKPSTHKQKLTLEKYKLMRI
jgi:hypothetical protein